MTSVAATAPYGWLRSVRFDLTFIVGVAILALASGAVVVAEPALFPIILVLDLWLLGYHHVVSTFTRLSFDRQSFRENWFYVVVLPPLVLAAVLIAAFSAGGWILSTTYLYWQWFHYTRQSYGIAKVYGKKAGDGQAGNGRLMVYMLYAVPLWGILHRSFQSPETFLGMELRTLPVPALLVQAVGVVAVLLMAAWGLQLVRAWIGGQRPGAQALYLTSHLAIFVFGYLAITDLDHGWLVINVWHNAQYILFVWLFNVNRFRGGVEPGSRLLSFLSQPARWMHYFLTCVLLSTVLYFGIDKSLALLADKSTLPLFLVVYQTINFHHYIVDGRIWKIRKKPLQRNLGLT